MKKIWCKTFSLNCKSQLTLLLEEVDCFDYFFAFYSNFTHRHQTLFSSDLIWMIIICSVF